MLKNRLFWKMLIIFWVIFILTFQVILTLSLWYSEKRGEKGLFYRVAVVQLSAAASIVENFGVDKFNTISANWTPEDKQQITVLPLTPEYRWTESDDKIDRTIRAPDGKRYVISYDLESTRKPRGHFFFNIPNPLITLGIVSGLIFSLLLGWSISRPINQIRAAFKCVSQGDLSVRLFPKMQQRYDEFSDVAKDFDSMAEHLDVLVKARDELLHDVSHELRTPLARLQLAIGLAQQNPEPGNVVNALERIELESQRLDKMIGEILAFSRSEPDQSDAVNFFDLIALVRLIIDDANFETQKTNVIVTLNYDRSVENHSIIKGNADLVRRAIENVIRNAIRYSQDDKPVNVTISRQVNQLVIEVRDYGPGVDENKLLSIFEPFVRLKSSLSGKGYGLGLAIAKKVVTAHGGKISAKNAKDSQGGLVITITLPFLRIDNY